jgi:nucleolar GTP-binding protein
VRSSSKLPRDKSGIRDVAMANKVQEINRQQQRKLINSSHFNKIGESDRIITTKMPKHLFSGKRKSGTHDRR